MSGRKRIGTWLLCCRNVKSLFDAKRGVLRNGVSSDHVWVAATRDLMTRELPLLNQKLSPSFASQTLIQNRGLYSNKNSDQTPNASKGILPDARECDDAVENFQRVRTRYKTVRTPSSIKSANQRVRDFTIGTWRVLLATIKFMVGLPVKMYRLSKWTRDDWSEWWSGVKKVVKEEAHHYWVGTKLLGYEVQISARLAVKAMTGKQLSRRERRQLTRTTADLFRLVPFLVIVAIPFMELALPLLLKVFPNMLPSTYEDKLKKEEELKKRLGVKLEVAKFLQETVAVMAEDINKRSTGTASATAADLYLFMNKVRSGEHVENHEIMRFGQLFNDELTLDNLERVQLVSLCQLLGITPFGTDAFLRSRLRKHLAQIKQDDAAIKQEGVDSLTEEEMRSACRARGMRAVYGEGARAYMRRELQDWIDLSLSRGLPSSLLLLSRAFTITASMKDVEEKKKVQYDSLRDTLSTLPEEAIKEVELEVLGEAGSKTSQLKKKLEQLKKEEDLIKEEEEEEKLAVAAVASTAPAPAAAGTTAQVADRTAQQAAAHAAAAAVTREAAAGAFQEVLSAEGLSEEEKASKIAAAREQRMRAILSSLAVLASSSGVAKERAQFMELVKKEIDLMNDTLGQEGTASLVFTGKGLDFLRPEDLPPVAEAQLPKRLSDRVSNILLRIERELDAADAAIGEKLHLIDLDNDGLITREELENAIRFLREQLGDDDLRFLLERLKLSRPDEDGGLIPVSELIKLSGAPKEEMDNKEVVQIHTR